MNGVMEQFQTFITTIMRLKAMNPPTLMMIMLTLLIMQTSSF